GAVWGDVDGDRRDELVLLERLPHPTLASTFVTRLHVWSCHERKPLWSQVLEATPPRMGEGGRPGVTWPLVADLDGDGRCEILVPRDRSHEGSQPAGQGLNIIPWGELALLAGDTGQLVWSRKLASIDTQVDHFRLGPDIDGD